MVDDDIGYFDIGITSPFCLVQAKTPMGTLIFFDSGYRCCIYQLHRVNSYAVGKY